jgi:hypothetical protein
MEFSHTNIDTTLNLKDKNEAEYCPSKQMFTPVIHLHDVLFRTKVYAIYLTVHCCELVGSFSRLMLALHHTHFASLLQFPFQFILSC